MDVNEHERLSNIILRQKITVKEQLVVRKDMDVNEHQRLSNITLRNQLNPFLLAQHKYKLLNYSQ
jgi:hypothetical protein